MIIARTRVWALAVTSQSARRSRYGRPSVREQRTGHCAARWRLRHGWQFGLLAGYGNMNTDFGNSTSSLVGFILRNSTLEAEGVPSSWTTLPSGTTNGAVFGGFIGYNMQWDQLVLGWDLPYKAMPGANSCLMRRSVSPLDASTTRQV